MPRHHSPIGFAKTDPAQLNLAVDLPEVLVDLALLERILIGLAINAVRYSPTEDHVLLTGQRALVAQIQAFCTSGLDGQDVRRSWRRELITARARAACTAPESVPMS
jgi:hypothetical protein